MADMNDIDTTTRILLKRLQDDEPRFTDERFTQAVMAGLPRRHALRAWQKNAILLAATLIGSGLATAQIWRPVFTELSAGFASSPLLLLGVAAVITYASAAVAVWTARAS